MKKQNRRSKRTSTGAADYSSPEKFDGEQQQLYEKRVHDLEIENESLKMKIEELKCKLVDASPNSVDRAPKSSESEFQKLQKLEEQLIEMKRKLNLQYQLSIQRQRTIENRRVYPDEVQRLKAQKVQLMCKMKLDAVQYRLSKASLEKEILQLKKEQRRNEYEMRKLLASNQRQRLVLQRKTEEAHTATKRLTELLESRKSSAQKGDKNDGGHGIQTIEFELKIAARVDEIRAEYERQMEEMAEELRKFEEEAETLREENFRFQLQIKEADCMAKDSELTDLKEEITALNKVVSELVMTKTQQVNSKKPQVDQVSFDSMLNLDTFESRCPTENASVVGTSAPEVCCSCGKRSLCKTSKCECRAAGGSCGTGCGCTASKCTNREVLKVDDSPPQPDVLVQDSVHALDTSEKEKANIITQLTELEIPGEPKRKPLCDMGNTMINSSPAKPGQKNKSKKTIIQLDNVEIAGGTKQADNAQQKIPSKLTRSMRSAITNKNSEHVM